MISTPRLLLFEVLELPWYVLGQYAQAHPRSHIAHLLAHSVCAEVLTEEPEKELRHWVCSATLHRGVGQEQHALRFLNQFDPLLHPPIWVCLAQQGRRIGVFGTPYSYAWKDAAPEKTAFYIPDKFAPDDWAKPQSSQSYQRLLRAFSRMTDQGFNLADSSLRGTTAIARYMISRIRHLHFGKPYFLARRWRMSFLRESKTLLSARLAAYEFLSLYVRHTPDFAVFTSGTVATALHRSLTPYLDDHADSSSVLSTRTHKPQKTSLSEAMDELNSEVGALLKVAAKNKATLVVVSGYGQTPSSRDDNEDNLVRFWLLHKPQQLLQWLGLGEEGRAMPSMLPCATLRFNSNTTRNRALKRLDQLRRAGDGDRLFYIEVAEQSISLRAQPDALSLKELIIYDRQDNGTLHAVSLDTLGLVARDRQPLCGEHSPGGVFLAYNVKLKRPQWVANVETSRIAPTLMAFLSAQIPSNMMTVSEPLLEALQSLLPTLPL